jgi:hypothetical protein
VGVALQRRRRSKSSAHGCTRARDHAAAGTFLSSALLPSADLCKRTSNAPWAIPLAGAHGCPWYLVPGCFWGPE